MIFLESDFDTIDELKDSGIWPMDTISTKHLVPYLKRDLRNELTIVDIGTGMGHGIVHILENVSKVKAIHTVDPYLQYGNFTQETMDSIKNVAKINLGPWIQKQKVFMYASLDDLSEGYGTADVLIIDADQTYTGTLDVLNTMAPSLSKKCVVAVVGVKGPNGEEVKRAITDFRKAKKHSSRIYVVGNMWFWYSPGEIIDNVKRKKAFNPADYSGYDSYSQLNQDLWVLHELDEKKNGFFVEFGASDGVVGSNTLALEGLGWRGILAEPNPHWIDILKNNRKRATITNEAVYKETGKTLNLVCPPAGQDLATLEEYRDSDYHSETRKIADTVQVTTISLNDLLKKYKAPTYIDYMSVDTEGSEYEILEAFDFDKYTVKLITVEHNFSEDARNKIYNLLKSKGYKRVYEAMSRWDDFYVKE